MGDLLVELAAHDKSEHLPLPRGQRRHQRAHFRQPLPFAARGCVPRHRAFDGAEQLLRLNRLGKKILGTGLDGLHGRLRVGMPRQEHDWQGGAKLVETSLQFRPAQSRYLHV